eukprot:3814748-Amphidinium_carterae.1
MCLGGFHVCVAKNPCFLGLSKSQSAVPEGVFALSRLPRLLLPAQRPSTKSCPDCSGVKAPIPEASPSAKTCLFNA